MIGDSGRPESTVNIFLYQIIHRTHWQKPRLDKEFVLKRTSVVQGEVTSSGTTAVYNQLKIINRLLRCERLFLVRPCCHSVMEDGEADEEGSVSTSKPLLLM